MLRQRVLAALLSNACIATPPRDVLPLDAPEWPLNYRLHLEGAAHICLTGDLTIVLEADGPHDIAVEHPDGFRSGAVLDA